MNSETTTGRKPGTGADAPREEKPSDVSDGAAICFEPVVGAAQRRRFEPRDNGRVELWEEEWTGCEWQVTGRVTLDDVTIETEYGEVDLFTLTSYAGPYLEVEAAYQDTSPEIGANRGEPDE